MKLGGTNFTDSESKLTEFVFMVEFSYIFKHSKILGKYLYLITKGENTCDLYKKKTFYSLILRV